MANWPMENENHAGGTTEEIQIVQFISCTRHIAAKETTLG